MFCHQAKCDCVLLHEWIFRSCHFSFTHFAFNRKCSVSFLRSIPFNGKHSIPYIFHILFTHHYHFDSSSFNEMNGLNEFNSDLFGSSEKRSDWTANKSMEYHVNLRFLILFSICLTKNENEHYPIRHDDEHRIESDRRGKRKKIKKNDFH